MPEWYPLIRAARYLGVPPWQLAEMPVIWQEWALMAESAEAPPPKQREPGEQWR